MKKPKVENHQYHATSIGIITVEDSDGCSVPQEQICEAYEEMIDALIELREYIRIEKSVYPLSKELPKKLDMIDKALKKAGVNETNT